MDNSLQFFTVFGAVLAANLLTILFVIGAYTYSRHEREGTAGQRGTNRYAIAMLAPLAVLALVMMVVFDAVPEWLEFISQ